MRVATLVVLVIAVVGTSGYLIKVPVEPVQPKIPGWVHIQKLMLPLFENVCEDSTNPTIVRLAQEFDLDPSSGIYLKPDVINKLQSLKSGKGLIPKGDLFTEFNIDHMNELKIIYEVLHFAKDFDTFYKAAAWFRQHVNCGIFVDAIYLAVLNRRDTEKLSVPAPYELLPNYFIQKDVIIKASSLLSGGMIAPSETVRDEGNSYILEANYTSSYIDNDDESKLAYFHEDIGLNCYYFLQKLKKAPWFNSLPDMSLRYGEYLYHMMKQLSSRYSLERYANGLVEVESINWEDFKVTPYDPMLIYSNGNEFGHRSTTSEVMNNADIQLLQGIEDNLSSVVTHMKDIGYNKTQILNHLMEILVTGNKSYETIARNLIGQSTDNDGPPALAHYMTSLRDPVFWRLNKKIVELVEDALAVVPTYTRDELYFPGVEVLNIDIKKMMTMFDYFQFDVTDALKSSITNNMFQVKIGQSRLNHKPFVMKLNISSLVTQKSLVKLYLGPKIAPGELNVNKDKFILLDSFEYNLKMGINVITRSSEQMVNLSGDFTSLITIKKKVEDAVFGLDALPLRDIETITGFPSRLILPKGTPEGLPLQIFAFVAPFIKATVGGLFALPTMEFNSAILSPGYPLDLTAQDTPLFQLPNAMVKDFIVTHKAAKPSGGDYGGKSWKGDFTGRKEPFDYSSKKGQYGKKEEYSDTSSYDQKSMNFDQYENDKITTDIYDDRKEELYKNISDTENLMEVIPIQEIRNDISEYNTNKNQLLLLPKAYKSNVGDYGGKNWRGDFSSRKEPFDYNSKKHQYGKKEEYSGKRNYYKKDFNKIDQYENIQTVTDIPDNKKEGLYNKPSDSESFIQVIPTQEIHNGSPEYNSSKKPLLLLLTKPQFPTVFDYIIKSYDDIDEKVYE